jgi:hypothetical protein
MCYLCYFLTSYELLRPRAVTSYGLASALFCFTQRRRIFTSYQLLTANCLLLTVNSVTFVTFLKIVTSKREIQVDDC